MDASDTGRRRDVAYLDYNATAPVRADVIEAMSHALAQGGNPSSVHEAGRAARRLVENARAAVASRAGCRPAEVIFTSGGTEANNMALCGLGRSRLLWSATEHESICAVAHHWPGPKAEIPVDENGLVNQVRLAALLDRSDEPALVAIMLANNETGVIQPIADLAAIIHDRGGLLHVDAIQGFGKIGVHFGALHADSMSLSGHKIGGPPGVGALLLRERLGLSPLIRGGGQELRRRAGTENLPGIVGFGVAADGLDIEASGRVADLRDALERRLLDYAPDAVIFSRGAPRLPNTTCVAMPGVASEIQVMALDLAGVAVSAGAACSSGKVQQSHVLAAMGAGDLARCSLRVSLGRDSTDQHVDRFLDAWCALYDRTRRRAS